MIKYEWRKNDKHLYLPGSQPVILEAPTCKYICLDGEGNPNLPSFSEGVGVLYSLAYGLKMHAKKVTPEGYYDYTVFPLEGLWQGGYTESGIFDKTFLRYTIMIRQPDFADNQLFEDTLMLIRKKKPHPLLAGARFEKVSDGLCVQMMHTGSYDNEPESFQQMDAYCKSQELKRCSSIHREIYIKDARKTTPDKLKTVLRYTVK